MSALAAALVSAAGLFALGLGALALRRSFAGMDIGIQLATLGLVLAAVALFALTGSAGSLGMVIALALVAGAAAAATLLLALHVAAARAAGKNANLEPW